jgi:flagellar motility protein MotE (MotC chaperone)
MAGENEAEAKAEGTAEAKAKSSNPFEMKKILLLVLGAVVVFLGSVPLHLYLNGVLSVKAPHLKAIPGYASVDSILAVEREKLREEEEQARLEAMANEGTPQPAVTDIQAPVPEEADNAVLDEGQDSAAGMEATSDDSSVQPTAEPADGAQETEAPEEIPENDEILPLNGTKPDELSLPFDPDKMSRLVTVYEKMRPKQVALILSTMPERQSVMILSGMKNQSAAKVLAEMEPGRAARMSELLVRWDNHE